MRIAITFSVLFFLPCSVAGAAFTDFSDYAQTEFFETSEIFESNGMEFKAVDPFLVRSRVGVIVHTGSIFGPNHELSVGPGVEFLLPTGTQEVSFAFTDGAGTVIVINGLQPTYDVLESHFFSLIDGATVAGVSIETDLSTQYSGLEEGLLTLKGPISSLLISGIELSIDDVSVIVPEPSTATLLLAAGVSLLTRRRRRYT